MAAIDEPTRARACGDAVHAGSGRKGDIPLRLGVRRLVLIVALALLPLVLAACSDPMSTIDPQSDHADTIQGLYTIVFWLAAVVFVGVMVAVLALSIAFRERPGREAQQFHSHAKLEVLWTLIPVVIVVIIAVPSIAAIIDINSDPPEDALQIEVIGHQWWFGFRYPEQAGISQEIVTANELHLPAGRAASFVLRSVDVIHSFWIPRLMGKTDVVPGHANTTWFTPNLDAASEEPYLGQCAEFCGVSHANMRFRVFVDTPEDFEAWVANELDDRVPPATEELRAGEQLFLSSFDPVTGLSCVTCHTIQGTTATGTIGPNLTHVGSRSTIAAGIRENTEENLIRWLENPDREKPGVEPDLDRTVPFLSMPAWESILEPEEITSIAIYLTSLQ